jgi:hypothetical protein
MNTVNETAIKKLKLLFTVVERQKAEFYLDFLSQYEVNCQLVVAGKGTANSEIVDLLGLNNQKAVLLSVIREDCVDTVMNLLEEKFATIRNGKGIAFAVPMSSVIGVNLYQFLSNNRQGRGMQP